MNSYKLKIGIGIATLLIATSLFSDTVYLKSGGSVEGKIVSQSRTIVRLKVASGQIKVISKKEVRRIVFKHFDPDAEKRKREAERKKRQAEELRRKKEAEQKKLEAEKRKQELEERQNKEAELKKLAEEKRKQENEAQEALQEREAEKKRQAEAERRRREQEKRRQADKLVGPTWHGALMRSIVFPGWGQYYQGRSTNAWIVGGAFTAALAGSFSTERTYNRTTADYQRSVDTFLWTSPLYLSWFGLTITDTSQYIIPGLIQSDSIMQSRQAREVAARQASAARVILLGVYIWNLVDVVVYHPSQNQSLKMGGQNDQLRFAWQMHW